MTYFFIIIVRPFFFLRFVFYLTFSSITFLFCSFDNYFSLYILSARQRKEQIMKFVEAFYPFKHWSQSFVFFFSVLLNPFYVRGFFSRFPAQTTLFVYLPRISSVFPYNLFISKWFTCVSACLFQHKCELHSIIYRCFLSLQCNAIVEKVAFDTINTVLNELSLSFSLSLSVGIKFQ